MFREPHSCFRIASSILTICIASCGYPQLGHDNREKIALTTLFDSKSGLDEKAFSGALSEKFVRTRSSVSVLRSYVGSIDGTCGSQSADLVKCTIPISGGFCVGTNITLFVYVQDEVISNIQARQVQLAC